LALPSDRAFMRGLGAAFFFYFANQSFYLVMTLYMQQGLGIAPLQGGMVFVPLALTFVVASRQSAGRVRHRGTLVLIAGCVIQIAGLAALVLTLSIVSTPTPLLLALVLTIFGYGQGLVMAPLSSAVLSTVRPASAGSGAGLYGTTAQIANAAGVAVIGAVFLAIGDTRPVRIALFGAIALFAVAIVTAVAFLSWMRRASA
jgi:MFS family permease